jgi:hypothetical protein
MKQSKEGQAAEGLTRHQSTSIRAVLAGTSSRATREVMGRAFDAQQVPGGGGGSKLLSESNCELASRDSECVLPLK